MTDEDIEEIVSDVFVAIWKNSINSKYDKYDRIVLPTKTLGKFLHYM